MIFQPGSVILAAHKGPLSAFELDETEYMANQCGKFLQIRADCVDFSGKEFGRHTEVINVPEFLGTKKITGLKAFPLDFHESKEAITASLVRRGQLFESLAGHHYKAYDGTAITWDSQGEEVPIQVSGRVVIDIHSFNRGNMWRRRWLDDWSAQDLERLHAYRAEHGLAEAGHLRLTPYYAMLARSRTRGYSLQRKEWLEFFVEQVGEIEWNNSAFDKLVLPEDQKELILAFSESQLEGGAAFDDVISGKGKGIVSKCFYAPTILPSFSYSDSPPSSQSSTLPHFYTTTDHLTLEIVFDRFFLFSTDMDTYKRSAFFPGPPAWARP